MKKLILLFSVLCLSAQLSMISANPLTPEAALKRANMTMRSVGHETGIGMPELAYSAEVNGSPVWYSFNLPDGGYIIAGGDDVASPVLAVVERGNFDLTTLPPAMKWWLGQYSEEIALASVAAQSVNNVSVEKVSRSDERQPIAPMLKTRWNQDAPYNLDCPTVDGAATQTGCVATSMAQLMKYFNYPTTGKGENSYVWKGQKLSINFSSKPFAWDKMADVYDAASSDEAKEAVAWLMKCCGYAVDMVYGTSESSANIYQWAPALITYFGYASSCRPLVRTYFDTDTWETEIYNSLKNGSPVLYGGQGSAGGHAFVCDGYQGDGFYHFNWGWSGLSDGYYRLTALDPPALGTGGGAGGFNANQMAVVNIKPDFEGAKQIPCLAVYNTVELSYSKASKNISLAGTIINYTNSELTFKPGFELVNEKGETIYAGGDRGWTSLDLLGTVASYARKPETTLADGVYMVKPAFAVQGTTEDDLVWYPISIPANQPQSFKFEIVDGSGTFTPVGESGKIIAENMEIVNEPHVGFPMLVKAVIKNVSGVEAITNVNVIVISEAGKCVGITDDYPVYLGAGKTMDFSETLTINQTAGKYKLYIVTDYVNVPLQYNALCEPIDFELLPAAADIKLETTRFDIDCEPAAQGVNVNVTIGVKCTEGYYGYPIYLWVGHNDDKQWQSRFNTSTVYLQKNESAELSASYNLTVGKENEEWDVIANYIGMDGNYKWLAVKPFTIRLSGVEDITADDVNLKVKREGEDIVICADVEIDDVTIYNMQGIGLSADVSRDDKAIRMHVSALGHGIYIVSVKAGGRAYTLKTVF